MESLADERRRMSRDEQKEADERKPMKRPVVTRLSALSKIRVCGSASWKNGCGRTAADKNDKDAIL